MKVNYEFEIDTYGKIKNEAHGVYISKKEFKNNKNARLKTFLGHQIPGIGCYLFVILLWGIIFIHFREVFPLVVTIVMSLFLIHLLLWIYVILRKPKSVETGCYLELTEEGFSDNSDGSKIFKAWDKFDLVVIGHYAITFILKDDIFFFFVPVSCEKDVKKALKKYCPKLKIMDKRRK